MKNIFVMGAGGHGQEAVWILESMNQKHPDSMIWNILGYVDDTVSKKDMMHYGYKVLGPPEEVAIEYVGKEIWYYCAIGINAERERNSIRLEKLGWKAATLIHPSVIIAKYASIAEGSYFGPGSVVCPNSTIGRHVIVNVGVCVGHDSVLGDFSQINPGAQITGYVKIGRGAFIGSNASIHPRKSVGDHATVGANSQVVRNVKSGATVTGVPAIAIR